MFNDLIRWIYCMGFKVELDIFQLSFINNTQANCLCENTLMKKSKTQTYQYTLF